MFDSLTTQEKEDLQYALELALDELAARRCHFGWGGPKKDKRRWLFYHGMVDRVGVMYKSLMESSNE